MQQGWGGEISRRRFLALAAAGGAGLALGPCLPGVPAEILAAYPFGLGVASGDPLADRVVLWTRLRPHPGSGVELPPIPVPVSWQVADDEAFTRVRRAGITAALPIFGHALHVDVAGLDPDRWYFYRFRAGPWLSPVGRTRTLPAPGSAPARLRFASASCQNYKEGFYTAHANLAREDLDFVAFLGDYIYESGVAGPVRSHDGPRLRSLEDYRNRYALYRSDPDLQAAHAAFPWIVTWDDHEVANNYARFVQDENAPDSDYPASEFPARRAAGYRAWWEHMPVRLPPPAGPWLEIFRRVTFGDLLDVFVLDTRQYRTNQECGDVLGPPCPGFPDPGGTLLGGRQRRWLLEGLAASTARWTSLAQQVVFAPTPLGTWLNFDQWDGYPQTRRRVMDTVRAAGVRNFVVLTGDVHASAVGAIPFDTQGLTDPLGSEFVATGITSRTTDETAIQVAEAVIGGLPHVALVNAREQGYVRHDVTRAEWRADLRWVDSVEAPVSDIATGASFVVADGVPGPQPA